MKTPQELRRALCSWSGKGKAEKIFSLMEEINEVMGCRQLRFEMSKDHKSIYIVAGNSAGPHKPTIEGLMHEYGHRDYENYPLVQCNSGKGPDLCCGLCHCEYCNEQKGEKCV